MAETTFTSIHWASPDGSGPMKKVYFSVLDEKKITPKWEKEADEFKEKEDSIENFKEFHAFLKTAATEQSMEFHADTTVIDLHQEGIIDISLSQIAAFPQLKVLVMGYNPLLFVDLTPLAKCVHLEELLLDKCHLLGIDLSFVTSCPKFRFITLRDTPIRQIDLTPLQKCPDFEVLNMEWNLLKTIDLSPLSTCKKLWFLGFQHNHLKDMDLTPLAKCKDLEVLYLHGNDYETLDVRPLANCPKLQDCRVDAVKIVKVTGGQANVCELDDERHWGEEEEEE